MAGLFANEAIPIVESLPAMLKLSLMEMGSPWNGPLGFPCVRRYASHSLARAIASWKKISDRQFVCYPGISPSSTDMAVQV